ncbi:MAG: alanine racemase [Nitrospirae bacterium]|nr:alanine racemase [Nitrospirota bacterium]
MEYSKTVAEIDLNALSRNLKAVRKKTRNKSSVLAVVKAGAYGHGSIEVSRHLLKNGAAMLGVAFTDEAIELREAGITAPILVFFDRDNIKACLRHSFTPVVFDLKTAGKISSEAYRQNRQIAVHVKVDTGMGRLGFKIKDASRSIFKIARMKNIVLEGLMSHFSDAELRDREFAMVQLKDFTSLAGSLKKKNIRFKFLHISNSAAILGFPQAHLNMVRPGIMLYGYGPVKNSLSPVLSLKSRIIFIKNVPAGTPVSYGRTFITRRRSTIATVPVGYADGYNRRLSNCGEVLINGRRATVVGRVCMDTIMIDVTEVPDVKEGSEVVLIGSQGSERITAQDIAQKTFSIPYEVLTSIGRRVRRVYKNDS